MESGDTTLPVQEQVYLSTLHPGHCSTPALFGAEMVRPLAACMIPVMLGALSFMLVGRDPLAWLTQGFPLAMAAASAWTVFQLRRRVVEVHIREEAVRLRSAWQVATRQPEDWVSLLDVRRESSGLLVTLGHDSRWLIAGDWPNLTQVEAKLRRSADSFRERVQADLRP